MVTDGSMLVTELWGAYVCVSIYSLWVDPAGVQFTETLMIKLCNERIN